MAAAGGRPGGGRMKSTHPGIWRAAVVLHGLLAILSVFILLDRRKNYDPPKNHGKVVPLPPGGPAPRTARVYVLLIDSLRYETAMDPAIMPHLARLRAAGASARVTNIHDAVTVPSVRTIFTGWEQVTVLAFVANFIAPSMTGVPSVFTQLQAAGGRSIVCALGEFRQFADHIGEMRLRRLPYSADDNEAQLLDAAGALARGEANLVVGHLAYTDYASHRYGTLRQAYRQTFGRADQLIAAVQERLPAEAVLVVMGDHGHTSDGRHSLGLNVPTFAVYAGGPFGRGVELGTIRLATNRYLLDAALGLPLMIDGYMGELRPDALAAYDPRQAATFAPPLEADRLEPPELRPGLMRAVLWVDFAVLAALWLNLALPEWSPFRLTGWRSLPAWLALLGCVLPLAWGPAFGVVAGLAALALVERRPGPGWQPWLWSLGLIVAGLGMQAWGGVLAAGLRRLPLMEVSTLHLLWTAAGIAGAVVATRKNRTVLAWGALAMPGLLLVPTNYRYGWNSVAVPALLCWTAFYLASVVRERRAAGGRLASSEWLALGAMAALIGLLVQALATGEAAQYVFTGWHPLLPGWGADNPAFMIVAGTLAGFILLCDRPDLPRVRLGALFFTLLLYPLQVRLWPLGSPVWPALIAAGIAAWVVAWRRRDVLATMLGRWVGLMLWGWWIRPAEPSHAAVCCVLAALVVAGRLMRRFPQPERVRSDRAFLLAVGIVAVGHAISRWSIKDLEWRAAYDWFSPDAVERYAVVVLIWVVAKGLAPWLVLSRPATVPGAADSPEPPIRAAAGIKCAAMLLIVAGLGMAPDATAPYREAVQQMTVLAMLTLYLLVFPP